MAADVAGTVTKTVILNNGVEMPTLGIGTWMMNSEEADVCIREAIALGYRHVDTASYYNNEEGVGRALRAKIQDGTVQRKDLFVTTKLWSTFHRPSAVLPALEQSLSRLGLPFVDLFLVHWPMAFKEGGPLMPLGANGKVIPADGDFDVLDTWKKMEEAVEQGLTRSIGMSNFNSVQLSRLLEAARVKPVTNQVEAHPYFPQRALTRFCLGHDIFLTAYCPIGGSPLRPTRKPTDPLLLEDPVIRDLAAKYHVTPAQICIRFLLQQRFLAIPKSVNPARLQENMRSFDFEISSEDMSEILKLDKGKRGRLVLFDPCTDHPDYPFALDEDEIADGKGT